MRKRGLSTKETAELDGISASHAGMIWQKYLRGGMEAIKPGKRGRRHGAQRILDAEQEESVQTMLVEKVPNQLKLPMRLSPEIASRAKKEKAEIDWSDETDVNNEAFNARGFAPKGHTHCVAQCEKEQHQYNFVDYQPEQGPLHGRDCR